MRRIPKKCHCGSTRITHNEWGDWKCQKCGFENIAGRIKKLGFKTYG